MTARTTLIGLVAGPLALAGCASSEATAPSSATTPEQSVTATAARQGGSPQEAAQLPCSDAVHGQVREVLGLDSVPTPESAWADDRATCTYQTPMGPLFYAVTIGTTPAAAQDHFETLRSSLRATTPVAGLPEAYRNGQGVVVAIEDTLVLSVDAGALPREHLGPDHQSHTGVAIVLATGVLDAWAGRD